MDSRYAIGRKLHTNCGITTAMILEVAAVAALLVLLSIPSVKWFINHSNEIGCMSAMDTANDYLHIEYLQHSDMTAKEAKSFVKQIMGGWEDICPGGGNIYIAVDKNASEPYQVICGQHDSDEKERCRYNASYAYELVKAAVKGSAEEGEPYPESVEIFTNNQTLTAYLTDEKTPLKHGTSATVGYKDTVIYYGIVGHSDFGQESGAEDGSVWYFSYADKNYCANYTIKDGWTGDSYE